MNKEAILAALQNLIEVLHMAPDEPMSSEAPMEMEMEVSSEPMEGEVEDVKAEAEMEPKKKGFKPGMKGC